jgi:hypothetical protein
MTLESVNTYGSLAIAGLALVVSLVSLRISRASAKAASDSAHATERQAIAAEKALRAQENARDEDLRAGAALQILKASEELNATVDQFRTAHSDHGGRGCTKLGIPLEIEKARRQYAITLGVHGGLAIEKDASEDRQIEVSELLEAPLDVLYNRELDLRRGTLEYSKTEHGSYEAYREMYCVLACALMDVTDYSIEISEHLVGIIEAKRNSGSE